jgi:Cu/Ag efflux protein CusF
LPAPRFASRNQFLAVVLTKITVTKSTNQKGTQMKALVRFAAILGIAAFTTTLALAADQAPKAEKADKPAKAKALAVSGKIEAIDAQAGTLTIDGKTVKVDQATKIATAANPKAAIADLKVGDEVSVKYVDQAGTLMAKSVGPVAAAKPAKEKKH